MTRIVVLLFAVAGVACASSTSDPAKHSFACDSNPKCRIAIDTITVHDTLRLPPG